MFNFGAINIKYKLNRHLIHNLTLRADNYNRGSLHLIVINTRCGWTFVVLYLKPWRPAASYQINFLSFYKKIIADFFFSQMPRIQIQIQATLFSLCYVNFTINKFHLKRCYYPCRVITVILFPILLP